MSRRIFIIFLSLCLAVLACNLPGTNVTGGSQASTPSAATATFTPQVAVPSVTPPSPTATATTAVQSASPTATSGVPCNLAEFVTDVSVPDGTPIMFNKTFSKTWRLKNVGSCTWTSGYQLVFDSGDQMSGPASQPLTNGSVTPGQTLDITVNLKAPGSAGTYHGNWKIREPGGELFGLSAGPFWVEIKAVANYQVSIPNWPNFRAGDKGAEVSAIQYLLKYHGKNLTVDGVFGPQTTAAVKSFQSGNGLSSDGVVGPNTWSALIQGAQVGHGKKGDAVRAAQTLLNKFGASLNVDGNFGPQTVAAVKDFQSGHGLAADGIVGPQTWQALVGY
jgi:hypothetical protein